VGALALGVRPGVASPHAHRSGLSGTAQGPHHVALYACAPCDALGRSGVGAVASGPGHGRRGGGEVAHVPGGVASPELHHSVATCSANDCAMSWPAFTIIIPTTACHQ
jgi:hypothetical protein